MDRTAADAASGLLRVLGLAFAVAVVIGGAVGQGIMRSPGVVAGAIVVPVAILAVWLAGGLLAATDAFATVELAAAHPCAGGPYAFARRAFGPLAGTMLGWADWFQGVVGLGFIAVVFAEYVHQLGLAGAAPTGAIAVGLLLTVGAINWSGTRVSGASQTLLTTLKALLLLGLAAALILAPGAPAEASAASPTVTLAGIVVALRLTGTTYAGWNASCYFCEEIHAPERNLARGTFAGIAIITLLYLAINAGLLHALGPAAMAASKLPAADALQAAFGGASGLLITVLAVVSVAAITNLQMMLFTRTAYAMGRDRALPAALARVAPGGTPRFALVATMLAAAGFGASGSYTALVAVAAVPAAAINLVVDLAAIRLRKTEPDLPRPFRMPLFPLPALIGATLNAALIAAMVWEDPGNSLVGAVLLALVAAFFGARRWRARPALA